MKLFTRQEFSMESILEDHDHDASEVVTDANELLDDTETVQDQSAQVTDLQEAVNILDQQTDISNEALEQFAILRDNVYRNLGMSPTTHPSYIRTATEDSSTKQVLKYVLEQEKNFLQRAWDTVVTFLVRIWNNTKNFLKKVFGIGDRNEQQLRKARENLRSQMEEMQRNADHFHRNAHTHHNHGFESKSDSFNESSSDGYLFKDKGVKLSNLNDAQKMAIKTKFSKFLYTEHTFLLFLDDIDIFPPNIVRKIKDGIIHHQSEEDLERTLKSRTPYADTVEDGVSALTTDINISKLRMPMSAIRERFEDDKHRLIFVTFKLNSFADTKFNNDLLESELEEYYNLVSIMLGYSEYLSKMWEACKENNKTINSIYSSTDKLNNLIKRENFDSFENSVDVGKLDEHMFPKTGNTYDDSDPVKYTDKFKNTHLKRIGMKVDETGALATQTATTVRDMFKLMKG